MQTPPQLGTSLVIAHLRWTVVLAILKVAEKPQHHQHLSREIRNFIDKHELAALFADTDVVPRQQWEVFFTSHRGKTLPSFIPSVDDCAAFYGERLPHNLTKRFRLLLKNGKSKRPVATPADPMILSWGDYATRIVKENGGWEKFASSISLGSIRDFWPVPGRDEGLGADDPNSFAQRILHLSRHRYVQVLTSTVGVLWPFWFLADRRWTTFLRKVELNEGKGFRIGQPLPAQDRDIYLDIYIQIGDFDGCPYPFGHADNLLRRGIAESQKETSYDKYIGSPWPTEAVEFVREALSKEGWCPPLLLPGRAPEFEGSDNSEPNRAMAVFTISRPCESFFSSYKRLAADRVNLRVVYEPRTWAEEAVNSLEHIIPVPLSRQEMSRSFANSINDLVLSYFPVDLLIQANSEYSRLSPHEIFSLFHERGQELLRPFPATVIGSGAGILRQAGMRQLILDLVAYVHKTYSLIRHLQPDQSLLRADFEQLRHARLEDKRRYASAIEQRCHASTSRSPLWRKKLVVESTLREWMTDTLFAMIKAVGHCDIPRTEEFVREWGWALLQEYVDYTWLFVSHDLADRRSQN